MKLLFGPTVGGFSTSPCRVVFTLDAFRSRSLVVDIWLTAMSVDWMNETAGGMGVP